MDGQLNAVKQSTLAAQPIIDKLKSGDTSITPTEAQTLSAAFDGWHRYMDNAA